MVKQNFRLSIFIVIGLLIFNSCEDRKDTTPPEVTITSPQDGSTVNEIVTITCMATDNKGVKKVVLWVDGKSTGVTDKSEPYSLDWNTTTYEDGDHTIIVRSIDESGNKTDSELITLIVDNSNSFPSPIILYSGLYTNNSFLLKWTKSHDTDFNSYILYESTSEDMGNKISVFNTNNINYTSFVVTGISENMVRYYQIIVRDTVGLEFSSEIKAGSSYPKIFYNSVIDNNHNTEIFLMDIFGRANYNLTNSKGWDGLYNFSPDGKRIVFVSSRNGISNDIYIMNVDGNNLTNLTNNNRSNLYPRFSPDGSKIVFTSDGDVYIMNVDGSHLINLTNDLTSESNPRFSPDGTQIVYESWNSPIFNIFIINIDGTGKTNLTNDSGINYSPRFSPDGSKIIFISDRKGEGTRELFIMNKNGSNVKNLTNDGFFKDKPEFSPDGNKIVYRVNRGGVLGISRINIDGTNKVELTDNSSNNYSPQYSPDGLKIVFVSERNNIPEIYIMDNNGNNQTRLTNNIYYDSNPIFQP